jgi:cell division protein FtsA
MQPQTPSITAGIDIGSSTTRVIITEHAGSGINPRVIGVGKSETIGMTKGYIVQEEEAARSLLQAIRMAEKMAGIALERAYVCMGGVSLETHHRSSNVNLVKREITAKDIAYLHDQIQEEFLQGIRNKSILHAIVLQYRLDGEEIFADPVGLSGSQLSADFSLVTCLTQHRDAIVSVVGKCGIDIIDIVAAPIAASVVALSKRAKTAGSALVDIGSETLSLSIFEHDALVHVAVIPCGASLITNDLALELKVSLDEAEDIKFGKKTDKLPVTKRKIYDIMEARIMDMMEIIQKKLILWNRNQLLPGGITLIGGGSHNEHIDTYARTLLKLPAQILEPGKIIPSKKDLDASWFSVYGLCLLGDQNPTYRSSGVSLKKLWKDIRGSTKDFFEQFLP